LHKTATSLFILTLVGCARQPQEPAAPVSTTAVSEEQVRGLCAACHAYPPPDSFPKGFWRHEVDRGYEFYKKPPPYAADLVAGLTAPPHDAVVRYYEKLAPDQMPLPKLEYATHAPPVRFKQEGRKVPGLTRRPSISHVNLVHLYDDKRLDILTCDMQSGAIRTLQPYVKSPEWRLLAQTHNPAHAEVVDLDGDGIKDLLVADLGSYIPTDKKVGRVVWLRGRKDGSFEPITLLEDVGRVADVQVADFNGDGKPDLVVAVFGLNMTGSVLYLENQTTDWSQPRFVPHVVDGRPGAIHVPVCDINGDGKPDFIALISQEFETVVAFVNQGNGQFNRETIYTGPHPAFGSSGIQLVDLDGDGRLDVLLTNGDVFDPGPILRPFHGIHWLQNRGSFPFEHHLIAPMFGVMRAVAADFRGTGRRDVVGVACVPEEMCPARAELKLDSVIYLEQTEPGQFVRHSLENVSCDHISCAAGDLYGDGVTQLVVGTFCFLERTAIEDTVVIWKNQR
jgi:hypothetical protein